MQLVLFFKITKILAHLDAGGTGLDPEVQEALATLKSGPNASASSAPLRICETRTMQQVCDSQRPLCCFFRAAHESGVGTFRTSADSARTIS